MPLELLPFVLGATDVRACALIILRNYLLDHELCPVAIYLDKKVELALYILWLSTTACI